MTPNSAATSQPEHRLPLGELKTCFITKLDYALLPQVQVSQGGELDIASAVQFIRDTGVAQLTLTVTLGKGKEPSTYVVEAEAVVLMDKMTSDAPQDVIVKHVARVAGPIAFGLIRDTLATLSGRSPLPLLMLPLIPMGAFLSQLRDDTKAALPNSPEAD